MIDETIDQRRDRIYLETLAAERFLWWLSFTDPAVEATIPKAERRPGGPAFLGVCIVEAATVVGATLAAHAHGCNPGGQVLTLGPLPLDAIGPEWRNRLLTAAEADSLTPPRCRSCLGELPPDRPDACRVCGPEHGGGEVRDLIYPQQVARLKALPPGARVYSKPYDALGEAALMDEMTTFIDESLTITGAASDVVVVEQIQNAQRFIGYCLRHTMEQGCEGSWDDCRIQQVPYRRQPGGRTD